MTVYDKLVRDKIPEILNRKGKSYLAFKADDKQAMEYLTKKLFEEAEEFYEEPSLEELADIQEVVYALLDRLGYSREQLELTRENKESARGAFKDGWILGEVLDD
jgi:predicted house-cleaning noncanonical NTP pyrophosphatase (MazG superfamily)